MSFYWRPLVAVSNPYPSVAVGELADGTGLARDYSAGQRVVLVGSVRWPGAGVHRLSVQQDVALHSKSRVTTQVTSEVNVAA